MYVPTMPDLQCVAHLGYVEHIRWLRTDGSLVSLEFGAQLRGHAAIEALSGVPPAEVEPSHREVAQRLYDDDRRVGDRISFRRRPILWWSRSTRTLAVFPFDVVTRASMTPFEGHLTDVVYDLADEPQNVHLRGREYELLADHKLYESWHYRQSDAVGRLDAFDAQRAWPMESAGRCYSIMYSSSKRLPARSMRGRHLHHHEYPDGRFEDTVSISCWKEDDVPRAVAVRGPRLDVESRGIVY